MIDYWNPNNWPLIDQEHEFRIYTDNNCNQYAIVDEVDYHFLIRWCWCLKVTWKNGKRHVYPRRAISRYCSDGKRNGSETVYLHVEVMKRTGIIPPSPLHVIVDHRNGNTLDCRRANLRWATHHLNCKNRNGNHAHELIEG